MHVEDMDDSIPADVDVRLKDPAFFPSLVREIMVLPPVEPKSCEGHVAIVAPVQGTVRAKAHSIIAQSSRNLTSLVELRTRDWGIHHLLQAHNVCV
jgi:hypothetical protein